MTGAPHSATGNSHRDQLVAALLVGGVIVVLGAASGLGIAITSGASAAAKPPVTVPSSLPTSPSSTSTAPVNYIGVPGPGNIPPIGPPLAGSAAPSGSPAPSATGSRPTAPGSPTSSSTVSPSGSGTPTYPTMTCPSDVVTALLDVLLGKKGLTGSGSNLLQTVLALLPNLASLLRGLANAPALHTNLGEYSIPELNAMGTACTPVLSGLLGGRSG